MIRTETYCGGALVKEIAMIDLLNAQSLRHEYVDGTHRWLFHGDEIHEGIAKLMILRAAVQRVLDDEESGEGGWGPDVTMVTVLREAMEATK